MAQVARLVGHPKDTLKAGSLGWTLRGWPLGLSGDTQELGRARGSGLV